MDIMDTIKNQIEENAIILYMKGSPNAPQCGFSQRASQALMACGQRFAYVDILSNPEIRANLPKYANWPTFPQLWVKGELIGGCDIIMEMHEKGELKTTVDAAAPAEQDLLVVASALSRPESAPPNQLDDFLNNHAVEELWSFELFG